MKRSVSIFASLFLMVFMLTQVAHAEKFSAQQFKKMSTFISNFTETFMWNFNLQQLLNANDMNVLIDFGVAHNFINYEGRRAIPKGNEGYIEGKWVKEAIKKYFDYDIKELKSTQEYKYDGKNYIYMMGSGEARYYAKVTYARKVSANVIEMKGYIYNAETDEKAGKTFVALAKPYKFQGKNTWSLISLTSIDN